MEIGRKPLIWSLLLKIMNAHHCWWTTTVFYDFFPPSWSKSPAASVSTTDSLQCFGGWCDPWFDTISRGSHVHLKVNGSPVKMEWIYSSVNYQRDGGERRVCWSEWCLMHSIPTSSFLGSSFCDHHITSDQVSIPAGPLLSCTAFLFPLLSFASPLLLFMTPWWAGRIPIFRASDQPQ